MLLEGMSMSSLSEQEATCARRHSRFINEGVRFKSLLRKGLGSCIRDRMRGKGMLSALLLGAGAGSGSGGVSAATTSTTSTMMCNTNNNENTNTRWKFLSRWLGMLGIGRVFHNDRGHNTDRADNVNVVVTVTNNLTALMPNADASSTMTTTSATMKANIPWT